MTNVDWICDTFVASSHVENAIMNENGSAMYEII